MQIKFNLSNKGVQKLIGVVISDLFSRTISAIFSSKNQKILKIVTGIRQDSFIHNSF